MIESPKNSLQEVNKKREETINRLIENGIVVPKEQLSKVQEVAKGFKHNRTKGIDVIILGEVETGIKIKIPFEGVKEYTNFWSQVRSSKSKK